MDRKSDGDWVEDIAIILTGGDITKRDTIIWSYTFKEVQPWLKYKVRDIKFREVVITFIAGPEKDEGSSKSLQGKNTIHDLTDRIGKFCSGLDVSKCRKYFGEGLARACATCPN